MTIKELRDQSKAELQKLLAETRAEAHTVHFKIVGRQETKVRKLRDLKRTVAKILTVLNEQRHD